MSACRAADPGCDYEHVGDLLWAFRDPGLDIRLWESAQGELLGYAYLAGGSLVWAVRPDWDSDEPLRWAGSRAVSDSVREDNAAKIGLLEAAGFVRSDRWYVELIRPLDEPVAERTLSPGYRMRGGPDEPEIEAYVEMHRDAWGPNSSYTAARHHRLRAHPGYDPELNPVVVAPDGEWAASCICWLDERNRSGEIEPLGTRHAHRRLGLARAVVLEAAHRLRERGAASVLVYGASVNEPARRLYLSAGFRQGRKIFVYERG